VIDILVSALEPSEVTAVAHIHASCFDEAWDETTIRKVVSMPGAFGLTARAERDGEVAGFAFARVVADKCELLSLGVALDLRSRGYGATLLDAAMARAMAVEAARFYLEVAEDNVVAQRLYRTRGLVLIGRRPRYYRLKDGGRTAALTMRCDLPRLRKSAS
jgi:ribosomal-protein-alanine N-acetyltransferase